MSRIRHSSHMHQHVLCVSAAQVMITSTVLRQLQRSSLLRMDTTPPTLASGELRDTAGMHHLPCLSRYFDANANGTCNMPWAVQHHVARNLTCVSVT
jgi:hypothetical protein